MLFLAVFRNKMAILLQGKKEAIERRAREDEERRLANMPEWKKQLIVKKMEDPKR